MNNQKKEKELIAALQAALRNLKPAIKGGYDFRAMGYIQEINRLSGDLHELRITIMETKYHDNPCTMKLLTTGTLAI